MMKLNTGIQAFALNHSDGIEEADKSERKLNALAKLIISYCNGEGNNAYLHEKIGDMEVGAVTTIEERLSVCFRNANRKLIGHFETGMLQNDVIERFLLLLKLF